MCTYMMSAGGGERDVLPYGRPLLTSLRGLPFTSMSFYLISKTHYHRRYSKCLIRISDTACVKIHSVELEILCYEQKRANFKPEWFKPETTAIKNEMKEKARMIYILALISLRYFCLSAPIPNCRPWNVVHFCHFHL